MRKFPRLPKTLFRTPPGFKKADVKDFKKDMQNLGEEIAEKFRLLIIENIETNSYGFILADSTIRQKGFDTPFINGRTLIDSVFREGTSVSVENTFRSDSKLTNLQLAIVLEYGTKDKHIPSRPLWRYTFRDYKVEAKKQFVGFFEQHRNG